MTADDQLKCVEEIHKRVSLKLGPYGVLVEHEMTGGGPTVAEFTLKIPDADRSRPGKFEEVIVHLTQQDALNCHTDPTQLDCLPRAWARICADWAPTLFDEAKLPGTDGVDWRPQETLPEDFYAS